MVSPCLTLRWRILCFAGCGRFGVGAVSVADQLLVLILASNAQLLFESAVATQVWPRRLGQKRGV